LGSNANLFKEDIYLFKEEIEMGLINLRIAVESDVGTCAIRKGGSAAAEVAGDNAVVVSAGSLNWRDGSRLGIRRAVGKAVENPLQVRNLTEKRRNFELSLREAQMHIKSLPRL
jgi:hypothetical protein